MKKQFHVGISCPWGMRYCVWDVAENIDYLSPDLMAKFRNIDVPLLRIEAKNENDAVREYKRRIPEVKKFRLRRGWLPA